MKKINEKRYKEIVQLRDEKISLIEIGNRYGITSERVRQIINRGKVKLEFCDTHNSYYQDRCNYCEIVSNYTKVVRKLVKNNLDFEIERLSKEDRSKQVVIQRAILVKELRDGQGLSFTEIGRKLNRHRTTVSQLYENLTVSKRS